MYHRGVTGNVFNRMFMHGKTHINIVRPAYCDRGNIYECSFFDVSFI